MIFFLTLYASQCQRNQNKKKKRAKVSSKGWGWGKYKTKENTPIRKQKQITKPQMIHNENKQTKNNTTTLFSVLTLP